MIKNKTGISCDFIFCKSECQAYKKVWDRASSKRQPRVTLLSQLLVELLVELLVVWSSHIRSRPPIEPATLPCCLSPTQSPIFGFLLSLQWWRANVAAINTEYCCAFVQVPAERIVNKKSPNTSPRASLIYSAHMC